MFQVVHRENCEGFARYAVTLSELAQSPLYYEVWRFWIRRIVTIFLPFFTLAYFNSAIVYSIQTRENKNTIRSMMLYLARGTPRNSMSFPSPNVLQHHRLTSMRLRNATRMLVLVVMCYLVANVLDVFIAAWEYVD